MGWFTFASTKPWCKFICSIFNEFCKSLHNFKLNVFENRETFALLSFK